METGGSVTLLSDVPSKVEPVAASRTTTVAPAASRFIASPARTVMPPMIPTTNFFTCFFVSIISFSDLSTKNVSRSAKYVNCAGSRCSLAKQSLTQFVSTRPPFLARKRANDYQNIPISVWLLNVPDFVSPFTTSLPGVY